MSVCAHHETRHQQNRQDKERPTFALTDAIGFSRLKREYKKVKFNKRPDS